eukprot:10768790-Prorocentrum_lima.AAC.1
MLTRATTFHECFTYLVLSPADAPHHEKVVLVLLDDLMFLGIPSDHPSKRSRQNLVLEYSE